MQLILKFLLFFLLIPSLLFAENWQEARMNVGVVGGGKVSAPPSGPVACSSYTGVFCEDFDTGSTACGDGSHSYCYYSYTEGSANFAASSTTYDMIGTNCISIPHDAYIIQDYGAFTGTDPIYFLFKFRISALATIANTSILNLRGTSGGNANVLTSTSGEIKIKNASGSPSEASATTLSAGTSYWIRGSFTKATVTNSTSKISVWNGSAWDTYITITDAGNNESTTAFSITNAHSSGPIYYYDNIKFSATEFTDAPTTY